MHESLLIEIEKALAQGLVADAARCGVREATARVLLAMEPGEQLAMAEVARRMRRDPSTATRFVDRTEAEGLVARRPGTQDRRRRLVGLTLQGEEARRTVREAQARRATRLGEAILAETGLGSGQVEWFLGALARGLERHTPRLNGPGAS